MQFRLYVISYYPALCADYKTDRSSWKTVTGSDPQLISPSLSVTVVFCNPGGTPTVASTVIIIIS